MSFFLPSMLPVRWWRLGSIRNEGALAPPPPFLFWVLVCCRYLSMDWPQHLHGFFLKFGCQLAPPRIFLVQCIASVYFYFLCTEKRQMYWICLFPNVICIGIYSYTMLIHRDRVNQVSLIFLQERRVQASDFYQKKRWQERLRFRGLVFSIATVYFQDIDWLSGGGYGVPVVSFKKWNRGDFNVFNKISRRRYW